MIKRILVPTYGSEFSDKGGSYAIDIAKGCSAGITLVHVIYSKDGSAKRRLKGLDKDVIKDAEAFLETVSGKAAAEGIKAATKLLLSSSVSDAILKEARSERYDLIVLCSRDLTAMKKLLTLSVCEQVIKNAPCPVFVYR